MQLRGYFLHDPVNMILTVIMDAAGPRRHRVPRRAVQQRPDLGGAAQVHAEDPEGPGLWEGAQRGDAQGRRE